MSVQRKLNALLFELQTAPSPLAQAKILARSWRTLRELSPTDRRLLARHVGFDGAEQILEGLADKKMGFAPATLLQVLNKARATDGAEVTELLAAIRDPSRRDEAISRGARLAGELLIEDDDDPEQIDQALDQLQAVDNDVTESSEEARVDVDPPDADPGGPQTPPSPVSAERGKAGERSSSEKPGPRPKAPAQSSRSVPKPPPAPVRTAPTRVAPLTGWDHLTPQTESPPAEPKASPPADQSPGREASSRLDALSVFAALEAESSSLARLRALEREKRGLRGSALATIRKLLDGFPDGWVRRRALAALISAGIPESSDAALELIAGLDREVDRRWCLGALARRGDLKGAALERSLGLVSSAAGRRRLQNLASKV